MAMIASATALLIPLGIAGPAHAAERPAENDCNRPYGAVTKQPAPNRDCVGLDLRDGDDPAVNGNGGGGGGGGTPPVPPAPAPPTEEIYSVVGFIADGDLTLSCEGPGGPDTRDSAVSLQVEGITVLFSALGDANLVLDGDRIVGVETTGDVFGGQDNMPAELRCFDDHAPAHS
jgi:hypothetical protein